MPNSPLLGEFTVLTNTALKAQVWVTQWCLTLCNPTDCSLPELLCLGFSRQEDWSGLPRPSPGDPPDPGIKSRLPALQASLVAQRLKCLPAVWETWVRSLGGEDPLEKEMATHSSILAWRIHLVGYSPWGLREWSTSLTHLLLTIWATLASMWTCFFLFRDPGDWPGGSLSSADCSAVDGSGGCGQGTWVSYKVLTSGMLSALPMSVSVLPLRTNGYFLHQHQLSRKLI